MVAGEHVAVRPRQVGVVVAEVEREHLVGQAQADVPRGVIGEIGEGIEEIRRPQPVMGEFAGHVPVQAAGKGGAGILGIAVQIPAGRTAVQPVGIVIDRRADREVVVERIRDLAVELDEAEIVLDRVAAGVGAGEQIGAERVRIEQVGVVAGEPGKSPPARVVVVPDAEVERELAEGRPNSAVEIDLGRSVVRELDAVSAGADIELQVVVNCSRSSTRRRTRCRRDWPAEPRRRAAP